MAIFIIIAIVLVILFLLKKNKPHNDSSQCLKQNKPSKLTVPPITIAEPKPAPAPPRTNSQPLPTFKYDINNMIFLCHSDPDEDIYGISPMYWDAIADDILQVNILLDEASQKCDSIPITRIKKENIIFKPNRQFDDDFTHFIYSPFTKTGKLSKYPYYIKFTLDGGFSGEKSLFGNIYFTKDNQIGKAWIVSWLNHKCYTINCAIKDKRLQVTRIDLTTPDNSPKTCLYNYNAKN